jgi:uncharacterized membrane protein
MNAKFLQHEAFRAGIGVKGFDGIVETLGGVLLWFVKPSSFAGIENFWSQQLAYSRHDFIAVHMLHISERLASSDPVFASIYLLSHGLIKVILAVALWLNELWAYPLAIAIFGGFCVYQVYRYTFTHSEALLWLTVFDIAVVVLTWKEYRVRASERKVPSVSVAD